MPLRSSSREYASSHARSGQPGRRGLLAAVLGLGVVVATLYAQVAGHGFVYIDDKEYLYNNPVVRRGLTWEGAGWAFTSVGYAYNWHPLTWLSHMLDVQLFGLRPGAHHLVNVSWHIANTLLLFLVLRGLTGALWRSAVVALLFGIHPLHVESVAWVAERKDLLSTFFWLLTVWWYAGFVRRPGPARYLGALATFALGLLAKPMVVSLPIVLLLFDYWPLGRCAGASRAAAGPCGSGSAPLRLGLEKIPFLVLAIASSLVTLRAQERLMTTMESLPLWPRAANALIAYASYLSKALWPAGLTIFYPHPGRNVDIAAALVSTAFLAAATVLALRAAHPSARAGWFWYLAMLFPVIGLVQVGPQAMADRYTYLPIVGIFLIVVWTVGDLLGRHGLTHAAPALALGALVLLFPVAWRQIGFWHSNETLYGRAVALNPGSALGQNNLASVLEEQGRVEEAVARYREAIRIQPTSSPAYNNLGLILLDRGRVDEALALFAQAVQLTPGNVRMLTNYAVALAAKGRTGEAGVYLRRALELAPDDTEARQELARIAGHFSSARPGAPR